MTDFVGKVGMLTRSKYFSLVRVRRTGAADTALPIKKGEKVLVRNLG